MGDFVAARAAFKKAKGAYDAQPSFFFVIPQGSTLTSSVVTFTRVDRPSKVITVRTKQHEQAAQWSYYPVHVTLTAGTWRINVTAGQNSGCFVMPFSA